MDRKATIVALILAVAAIAIDQSTKSWAVSALRSSGGHLALPGPIDFTLSFNESNAFGLAPVIGHATRWFLMSVNFTVAAFIFQFILTKSFRPLALLGMALIMAGAIGNALDRLSIGSVVDFFDATKIGFPWIFNVADATLDVGIALLALSAILSERKTQSSRA